MQRLQDRTNGPRARPSSSLLCLAFAGPASAPAQDPALRTVVIDPGHGGIESGAKGRFGNLEKDITLAISLKLKALIEKDMGFEVVLTRDRDVDVSIENRSATANNHKAGLFISIHANGAVQRKAAGSETFFLSLNATDEETRRLAYLENNSTDLQSRIDPSSDDDLMMILWDMAQNAYIKQSSRLAELVQSELDAMLGTPQPRHQAGPLQGPDRGRLPGRPGRGRVHLQSRRRAEAGLRRSSRPRSPRPSTAGWPAISARTNRTPWPRKRKARSPARRSS